jgi:hypothetical protein
VKSAESTAADEARDSVKSAEYGLRFSNSELPTPSYLLYTGSKLNLLATKSLTFT